MHDQDRRPVSVWLILLKAEKYCLQSVLSNIYLQAITEPLSLNINRSRSHDSACVLVSLWNVMVREWGLNDDAQDFLANTYRDDITLSSLW